MAYGLYYIRDGVRSTLGRRETVSVGSAEAGRPRYAGEVRRLQVINLTDEMRELIDRNRADGLSCLLGTASADGRPQISIKGSVLVFDRETLAYWERAKRSALDNISQNPQVVIYYRNPDTRVNWRFHGTATVYETGAIRANVMSRTVKDEIDRDPERQGVAILVRVDRITQLNGTVVQQRE